ncbi:MAG: PD-(D/E)XK nuclease-like domain-containing protein [Prevotellaceae bacterium]|nr:PD-(D/E)XK nuclease-like domain-containing protein [Prevotellaceae bacterium]
MSMPTDKYYQRTEVSNSDLTELKKVLHPTIFRTSPEQAFRFGTLFDALVTEPSKVDYYRLRVDGEEYTQEEFRHARQMHNALRQEAAKDPFLALVLTTSNTQRTMVNQSQSFTYCDFPFLLATRCKWDWWLESGKFGGDLKSTSATTDEEFRQAIDHFDWDRSRAWYMDIAGSDRDFIYAVSKKNNRVFKTYIRRGDETYLRGREKYLELAFKYWCLMPQTTKEER